MSILDILEITHSWEPTLKSRWEAFLTVVGRASGNLGEAGLIEPSDISGDVLKQFKELKFDFVKVRDK